MNKDSLFVLYGLAMSRSTLKGKRILYGITGSIAAVKAPIVARELVRAGAECVPVLTEGALQFTTGTALSALVKQPTITSIFPSEKKSSADSGTWHIHLARSAAAMLIAPCSATTLGKLAHGLYDNPVTLLAASLPRSTPLVIAPAMDEEMWLQPAVQKNLDMLKSWGVHVIDPISGLLASGHTGMGRMLEPIEIVERLSAMLATSRPLEGKRVLITGGPTYEAIDAVRFIGNRSSGKMAIALAKVAENLGAAVTLIMGPSSIATNGTIERHDVESADDMLSAVQSNLGRADIIIMSAAVADFTPITAVSGKMKKRELSGSDDTISIDLKRTPDILGAITSKKRKGQIVIGFALEKGERSIAYAEGKLKEKELDFIVLNDLDESGAGFGFDTNKVTIFAKNGERVALPLLSKEECAAHIFQTVLNHTH